MGLAAAASGRAADRVLMGFAAKAGILRTLPFLGAPRRVLADHLRATFYRKYAIYYRPEANFVLIVRVLHGARDVGPITAQGGFDQE